MSEALDLAIEAARAECVRTYVGPGECRLPEYLAARRAFHALLVKAGKLDPRLADYFPIPRNGHRRSA